MKNCHHFPDTLSGQSENGEEGKLDALDKGCWNVMLPPHHILWSVLGASVVADVECGSFEGLSAWVWQNKIDDQILLLLKTEERRRHSFPGLGVSRLQPENWGEFSVQMRCCLTYIRPSLSTLKPCESFVAHVNFDRCKSAPQQPKQKNKRIAAMTNSWREEHCGAAQRLKKKVVGMVEVILLIWLKWEKMKERMAFIEK